jgi:hypothetical protein
VTGDRGLDTKQPATACMLGDKALRSSLFGAGAGLAELAELARPALPGPAGVLILPPVASCPALDAAAEDDHALSLARAAEGLTTQGARGGVITDGMPMFQCRVCVPAPLLL